MPPVLARLTGGTATLAPAIGTALATGLTLVAAPTGPAAARSVDESYPVPSSGTYVVRGHGYGHGHGMSQYGARGAARQGLSHARILAFYYPGTSLAVDGRKIRVLVTADTTDDVVVSPVPGLRVRDRAARTTYRLPAISGVDRWRLRVAKGRTVVAYRAGRWHRWRTLSGVGQFAARGKPITLWTPSGARAYRGVLRAARPARGSTARDTVNVLTLDDYVKGVVPYEIPAAWERAAVRAQAVAARTYAAWSRAQRPRGYYHICDTVACQVYGGVAGEDARSNAAVDETAGQILTYHGKPAFTQFSSSSGGWTSAGSAPYLVAKKDPYEAGSGNPYTDWSVKLSAATIERAYPGVGTLRRVRVTSREGSGDWGGRVWNVVLVGSKGKAAVSGNTFRFRFGLRSTYFTFGG